LRKLRNLKEASYLLYDHYMLPNNTNENTATNWTSKTQENTIIVTEDKSQLQMITNLNAEMEKTNLLYPPQIQLSSQDESLATKIMWKK